MSEGRHLGAEFYRWKKAYGNLQPSEEHELKQMRDEGDAVEAAGGGLVARQSHVPGRDPKQMVKPVRQRMREVAQSRVRFGYCRLRVLLQREGWEVGG